MLLAELHIYTITNKTKLRARDNEWDKNVRNLLIYEMGFLKFLKVSPQSTNHSQTKKHKDEIFVKFISGNRRLQGEDVLRIIKEVRKVSTKQEFLQKLQLPLYAGMSEAITNTHHHAYPKRARKKFSERWWISASFNVKTDEVKVVCYDRGLTIPVTLRDKKETKLRNIGLGVLIDLIKKDGPDHELMKVTIQQKKTSTKISGRGRGLSELINLIDHSKQGTLKIYSGKGIVEYTKDFNNMESLIHSKSLPRKMNGTLVEWSIVPTGEMSDEKIEDS